MSKGSKYKNKKNAPIPRKLGKPVFSYTSDCHSAPASKRPCLVDDGTKFEDRNKLEHSLGTWKCSICRKTCKVSRSKNKVESGLTIQEAAEAQGIFSDKEAA